jgi:hypothetical protein
MAFAGHAQNSLDDIVQQIDTLIALDQLESAREKLTTAREMNLRDERLDVLESRLNLFDNLELPSLSTTIETIPAVPAGNSLDVDRVIVTDLLDSLKIALENGELDKVNELSDSSEKTNALLTAVFQNYANVTTRLSDVIRDESTDSFFATLEFLELKTFDGDIAYPAENWNLHELRITKSSGEWQKIRW